MVAPAPLTGGLGLKFAHVDAALATTAAGLWFEVHAENHMVDGGPRLAWLLAVRERHPVSLHGVSLSLAGAEPPDPDTLRRLARLVARVEPALVSEHLAWSRHGAAAFPDLLPVPRNHAALAAIVRNVGIVQEAIGRTLAIENPAHYVHLDGHAWSEPEFVAEVARRSGCTLLLDVDNVVVAAHNVGDRAASYAPSAEAQLDAWLAAVDPSRIVELHVAGHRENPALGAALWIDAHDRAVPERVWQLAARVVEAIGPRPVLVERDADVPPFATLLAERARAHAVATGCRPPVLATGEGGVTAA